ncbi:hypothetical protein GCM10023220_70360 [Streptomyces ziwulingensis]|uniref:Uncharacterized protein n=1 Tax=Streptomyces ziwulingensis TaxID=1045501 RepID=A0ABP9D3F9_9ACTN
MTAGQEPDAQVARIALIRGDRQPGMLQNTLRRWTAIGPPAPDPGPLNSEIGPGLALSSRAKRIKWSKSLMLD